MNKPLSWKRILVCGKGGCGKSSALSLITHVLRDETYRVIVLDGDASNPGGLARLMFGTSQGPTPLIHFFGGREKVECPVDNPAPLTRINDTVPITEKNLDLAEIPPEYFMEKENILHFQIGKVEDFREGCDGPMSKVTRDFIVKGQYVQLIDVKAGMDDIKQSSVKRYGINHAELTQKEKSGYVVSSTTYHMLCLFPPTKILRGDGAQSTACSIRR